MSEGPQAFREAVVRAMVQIATATLDSMKMQHPGPKNARILEEVRAEVLAPIVVDEPRRKEADDDLLAELETAFAEDE